MDMFEYSIPRKKQRVAQLNNEKEVDGLGTSEKLLYSLLKNEQWDDVERLVSDAPKEVFAQASPDLEGTPLYFSIEKGAPSSVIECLLTPEAATVPNDFGFTPLFKACEQGNMISDATFQKILDAYPQAIVESSPSLDHAQEIFHIAVKHHASLVKLNAMIEAWMEQKYQSMEESWKEILTHFDGASEQLPLHWAIQEHAPSDVIVTLIQKHPKAVLQQRRTDKYTPLHVAAFSGCSLPVLESLFCAAPATVYIQEKGADDKNTPLHILFHPDLKDRWIQEDGEHDQESDIIPLADMARCIIKTHAYYLKRLNRKTKGRENSPPERAKKLLSLTNQIDVIRDDGVKRRKKEYNHRTVIEQAKALFMEHRRPRNLQRLIEEMELIGDYRSKLESWPELNHFSGGRS